MFPGEQSKGTINGSMRATKRTYLLKYLVIFSRAMTANELHE